MNSWIKTDTKDSVGILSIANIVYPCQTSQAPNLCKMTNTDYLTIVSFQLSIEGVVRYAMAYQNRNLGSSDKPSAPPTTEPPYSNTSLGMIAGTFAEFGALKSQFSEFLAVCLSYCKSVIILDHMTHPLFSIREFSSMQFTESIIRFDTYAQSVAVVFDDKVPKDKIYAASRVYMKSAHFNCAVASPTSETSFDYRLRMMHAIHNSYFMAVLLCMPQAWNTCQHKLIVPFFRERPVFCDITSHVSRFRDDIAVNFAPVGLMPADVAARAIRYNIETAVKKYRDAILKLEKQLPNALDQLIPCATVTTTSSSAQSSMDDDLSEFDSPPVEPPATPAPRNVKFVVPSSTTEAKQKTPMPQPQPAAPEPAPKKRQYRRRTVPFVPQEAIEVAPQVEPAPQVTEVARSLAFDNHVNTSPDDEEVNEEGLVACVAPPKVEERKRKRKTISIRIAKNSNKKKK